MTKNPKCANYIFRKESINLSDLSSDIAKLKYNCSDIFATWFFPPINLLHVYNKIFFLNNLFVCWSSSLALIVFFFLLRNNHLYWVIRLRIIIHFYHQCKNKEKRSKQREIINSSNLEPFHYWVHSSVIGRFT